MHEAHMKPGLILTFMTGIMTTFRIRFTVRPLMCIIDHALTHGDYGLIPNIPSHSCLSAHDRDLTLLCNFLTVRTATIGDLPRVGHLSGQESQGYSTPNSETGGPHPAQGPRMAHNCHPGSYS